MRTIRILTAAVLAAGFVPVAAASSLAATVTLDAAAKTASSDTAALELKPVTSDGEQIGLFIQSNSLEPQSPTVKVVGLKDGRYDVYVNWGAFSIERNLELAKLTNQDIDVTTIDPGYAIRDKDASDLAGGITVDIPGRVVSAELLRCVESVEPRIASAYERLKTNKEGESGRARFTLARAGKWARSAITADKTYRSAQLLVVPANVEPEPVEWPSKLTAKATEESLQRACFLLHQARVRMFRVLTDSLLRDSVVGALTPVEMKARYHVQDGVPLVRIEIANDCDLSASGTAKVIVPKGWQAKAKMPSFVDLQSGGVHTQTFELTRTSKGQSVPTKLTATAWVKVVRDNELAKVQLTRHVELETTAAKATDGAK